VIIKKLKLSAIVYNVLTLLILIGIIFFSLTSKNLNVDGLRNLDKVQHALAYAVLAFFFSLSVKSWEFIKPVSILTLVFCALIGGALEIIQSRFGRMMEMNDFIADLIGASLGTLLSKIKF